MAEVPVPFHGDPAEAAFAEAWGLLQAGRFSDAAELFDRAARAEPAAPLAEDSDFWRAVALTRARRPDSRAALKDFLERHPHSQRTGEASAMLGWQLFEIGEVGAAEAQFVTAAGDRVPRVLASAHAGLAAIAARRARAP